MTRHPKCTSCPNSPNYYWAQCVESYIHYPNRDVGTQEHWMYLFLYTISILGD